MGACCSGTESKRGSNLSPMSDSGDTGHRWQKEEHVKELQDLKNLQMRETTYLDKQLSLYQKMALEHMKNYEEVYGKEKADFWIRRVSQTGTFMSEEMDDSDLGHQSFMLQPSGMNFRGTLIEVLCTSVNDVLDKELWNLCDILALVVWTYASEKGVIGVESTLREITSRRTLAGQSIIMNPTDRGETPVLIDKSDEDNVDDDKGDDDDYEDDVDAMIANLRLANDIKIMASGASGSVSENTNIDV